MAEVRIIPLGVGDAFSAQRYTTCLALGAGDDWLLIDCPHPVRKMLREGSLAAGLPMDLDRFSGVLLSHLHADHCSGLEGYAFFLHFVLGRKAHVLAHPEVAARMWDGLLAAGMGQTRDDYARPPVPKAFDTYFALTPLSESAPVTFGPFSVECRMTLHPIPTTAFKVTAHGRVLGFSADTAFDPALIDWLAPADLIVHEATTLPESPVHTPFRHLAALPAALRAKMRVIHYQDSFDPDNGAIEGLRQGRCYPV
jgi:ribonuclease BN (tRNA processing enzyme)